MPTGSVVLTADLDAGLMPGDVVDIALRLEALSSTALPDAVAAGR